jgi:hypothetical protein
MNTPPKVGENDVCDVIVDGKNLRLISECDKTGFTALVYDLDTKTDVIREMADSFEHGKKKCEECVKGLATAITAISA